MNNLSKFFKKTSVKVASLTVLFFIVLICAFNFNKFISYYYVYEGDKAYKRENLQEAINLYRKALEHNPTHSKARYNLANIYVVYEDYFSASDEYEKVLEQKPRFMSARIDYGIVLSEALLDYDAAIREYRAAINLKPKVIFIPFILNNKKIVKHNTGVAFYNMGIAYRGKSLLMGENTLASKFYLEQARECYREAVAILKNDYDAWYNHALTNHRLGNVKEAGLSYCRAIAVEPFEYEAHYNLAILLRDLRKYPQSLEEFRKAGLLLDVGGDSNKTRYVYSVLNEVNKKLAASPSHEILKEEEKNAVKITYRNGKVVASEEFQKDFNRDMKKCTSKEFFEKF